MGFYDSTIFTLQAHPERSVYVMNKLIPFFHSCGILSGNLQEPFDGYSAADFSELSRVAYFGDAPLGSEATLPRESYYDDEDGQHYFCTDVQMTQENIAMHQEWGSRIIAECIIGFLTEPISEP